MNDLMSMYCTVLINASDRYKIRNIIIHLQFTCTEAAACQQCKQSLVGLPLSGNS